MRRVVVPGMSLGPLPRHTRGGSLTPAPAYAPYEIRTDGRCRAREHNGAPFCSQVPGGRRTRWAHVAPGAHGAHGQAEGSTMSRPLRAALLSAIIVGVGARYVLALSTVPMVDFLVYRQAGIAVQGPGSLYTSGDTLPFTYPPFAALVYTPFAGLSTGWARWLHTAFGAALLIWVLVALRRRLRVPLALVVATALTMPFIRSLQLGQVNPLIFALLVTDWVVLSHRTGILTGLAAGLKVTPAAFGLIALLRRDWRAASAAALAFFVTVGVGALLRPQDTWAFWTRYLWDPMRVGSLDYPDNQSLKGALLRLGVNGMGPYAVLAAATLAVGLLAAWRQTRAGDRVAALVAVGALGALV